MHLVCKLFHSIISLHLVCSIDKAAADHRWPQYYSAKLSHHLKLNFFGWTQLHWRPVPESSQFAVLWFILPLNFWVLPPLRNQNSARAFGTQPCIPVIPLIIACWGQQERGLQSHICKLVLMYLPFPQNSLSLKGLLTPVKLRMCTHISRIRLLICRWIDREAKKKGCVILYLLIKKICSKSQHSLFCQEAMIAFVIYIRLKECYLVCCPDKWYLLGCIM